MHISKKSKAYAPLIVISLNIVSTKQKKYMIIKNTQKHKSADIIKYLELILSK